MLGYGSSVHRDKHIKTPFLNAQITYRSCYILNECSKFDMECNAFVGVWRERWSLEEAMVLNNLAPESIHDSNMRLGYC